MQLFQRINDKQREGIAKVFDNFATANAVAAVLGGFIDHKLVFWQAMVLVLISAGFLSLACALRKSEGERDD